MDVYDWMEGWYGDDAIGACQCRIHNTVVGLRESRGGFVVATAFLHPSGDALKMHMEYGFTSNEAREFASLLEEAADRADQVDAAE